MCNGNSTFPILKWVFAVYKYSNELGIFQNVSAASDKGENERIVGPSSHGLCDEVNA